MSKDHLNKKEIAKLKVLALQDDEIHNLLKWRKKVYNKEIFHKEKRKEYLSILHQIDSKLTQYLIK